MDIVSGHIGRERDIRDLFSQTFTASEGTDEGAVVSKFVVDLMQTTPKEDMFVFSAYEGDILVGSIFFSRLNYQQDKRTVFILSPVAIKTDHQKKGIGQKLIKFGLNELRRRDIDFAITYGDPNFYARVGFQQISEEFAQAPYKLSHPEGWLAQSLIGSDMKPIAGPAVCVEALYKSELW